MRKLKIGFVFDDSLDKPDGVQQYVLTLGRWLTAQGHNVHYLVGETKRTDLPNLYSLSRNVNVRFNQNRMAIPLPARLAPIRDVLSRENFDVLHVQVPYSPALAARIIKSAGARTAVVGTFHIAPHSGLVSLGNRALGAWVRGTLKRFDAMLATSEPARQFALKTFHIDSEVGGLPLDLQAFHGAKPFEKYAKNINVVFLGRLVERKGCQYLLAAVAYAHQHGLWPVGAKVIICGGGPLEAKLKAQAAAANLQDIVAFVGYISEEDKPRYVASADVAVYPSTGGESFGIVLLEAMAAARGMVLAGDNPGYASVLAPKPELLFNPHDTKTFAKKLVHALNDKTARQQAHAWQQQYVRQYDVPVVGERTVAMYNRALHMRAQ
ncbi:MAG TPA: glycosyltransferase family 4 protein [Candidatus Saccharimonadales bacterium]|nr:glycosyltransferase family 4 protein [Candidatus Saccharimonadales bacterium]